MGKFDLDDLLDDMFEPDPAAPKEPSPGAGTPLESDQIEKLVSPAEDGPRGRQSGVGGATGVPDATHGEKLPMFVREDPRETPRPPDPTGGGLGRTVDAPMAVKKADPTRICPNDALTQIYTPNTQLVRTDTADLGQVLVARQIVNAEQLLTAQRVLKQTPGKALATILIESGADAAAVQAVVAELARLPFERIDPKQSESFDFKSLTKLGQDYCRQNSILPLRREGSRLVIGTANPDDLFLLDEVRRKLGVTAVKHVLVTSENVRGVIETLTETEADEYDVDEILAEVDEEDISVVAEKIDEADMEDAESSPVVRYVNHIIQTAMREGASDIHIEPDEKTLKVRFRIDGVLFEMMNPPRKMHAAITSRLKIMASLDIAERRLPQDGRIRLTVLGRKLDLRMSTIPTPKGEKTVMRILDTRSINVDLEQLGFAPDALTLWRKQIDQPHGIILVTGPTGSGKTTTLYSSLRQMDLRKLNISTVEDPIEYNVVGITQIQTHEKIGMTFARALKSILRQDPDVIMVGEIRDLETATTAIQAALTGHLVLSTLHTNDAPASITRLINIGTEPFLVGAAVNAILAQRLTRRICEHCKKPTPVTEEIAELLQMHGVAASEVMTGAGCTRCRETGYSGRVGLYELLVLDDFLRDRISGSPNVTEFRRTCIERGMVTLRQDGFDKVLKGQTTVEEILRVTQATI